MIHSEVFPNRKIALFFSSVFFSLGLMSVSSLPWNLGYVNFALSVEDRDRGVYCCLGIYHCAETETVSECSGHGELPEKES